MSAHEITAFDGYADALYRRHADRLRSWLARRIVAPQALVDDACQNAWLTLLRRRPTDDARIFGWLCVTALHESYRLLARQRREQPTANLPNGARPAFTLAGRDDPEHALDARTALLALASLRERQSRYLAWHIGGHRYAEIQTLAGTGTTYSTVNRHLVGARRTLRHLAEGDNEPAPRPTKAAR